MIIGKWRMKIYSVWIRYVYREKGEGTGKLLIMWCLFGSHQPKDSQITENKKISIFPWMCFQKKLTSALTDWKEAWESSTVTSNFPYSCLGNYLLSSYIYVFWCPLFPSLYMSNGVFLSYTISWTYTYCTSLYLQHIILWVILIK